MKGAGGPAACGRRGPFVHIPQEMQVAPRSKLVHGDLHLQPFLSKLIRTCTAMAKMVDALSKHMLQVIYFFGCSAKPVSACHHMSNR